MTTALDWLQFSGYMDKDPSDSDFLKIKVQEYGTRHFKKVAEVYDLRQNKKVAVLAWLPHSPAIPKNLVIVKISNSLLYQNYLVNYVLDLIDQLNIRFNNLTRIDICRDFQRLDYRNLKPNNFIKSYLREKYVKVRKSKGQVYFDNGGNLEFNYLKFGSAKSRICSYIYNKSKELAEVENKPHIREFWKNGGIDETREDVWRCEFRIQNFDFLLTDTETGEVINYNGNTAGLNSLDIINNCENLFNALALHYLEFKIQANDTNTTRKKTFYIFDNDKKIQFRRTYNDSPESGRAVKIFIKKLWELNNDLRGTDYELSIEGDKVLNNVIQAHQLFGWASKKQFI